MKSKCALISLILIATVAPASHAYVATRYWSSTPLGMTVNSADFPAGSDMRMALAGAVNAWNASPAAFSFSLSYSSSVSSTSGDGVNSIHILTGTSSTPPAECVWWYYTSTGLMTEADIYFYDNVSWTGDLSRYRDLISYGGSLRPLQTTALHELGHALGLDHENTTYNIMGQDWDHAGILNRRVIIYPGEDAVNGAVSIYGLSSSAGEDVSVTHFRFDTSTTGAYSMHERVEMYDSSGAVLSGTSLTEGTTRWQMSAGDTVQVEFTYENSGASTQSPDVEFRISTDRLITSSDTFVDSRRPTLGRNTVYTHSYTVTIPSSLSAGDYYLGVRIDPSNTITETREENNQSWVPIEIK